MNQSLHKTIRLVAIANLIYFCIEFFAALDIASVSLFADSIDFLEDAALNLLILIALVCSLKVRAYIGMTLAILLLCPTFATLWMIGQKITTPSLPEPMALSLVGAGALIVNFTCAYWLVRFRHHNSSLIKAAFYSARNDALANIGIIIAGFLTFSLQSIYPDLIIGILIALMNITAAKEVWQAARKEHTEAQS